MLHTTALLISHIYQAIPQLPCMYCSKIYMFESKREINRNIIKTKKGKKRRDGLADMVAGIEKECTCSPC